MIFLPYIILQFGDFYPSGDDSKWWLDLLNTIIGAAIGSGATIYALLITFRRDKEKEEAKSMKFQKEKLKYLQSLLRITNTNLERQISYLKSYSQEIRQNPIDLALLRTVSFKELDRIVNKINQEDYYHSYLGVFGDNSKNHDEFRDIISILNYFDGDLLIIKDSLKSSFDFDYERKVSLKNMIEKAMEDTAALLIDENLLNKEHEFLKFINSKMVEFHKKEKNASDLKFYYENFVDPMKNGLLGFTNTIPAAHRLIVQLKNATVLYYSIQQHNLDVATDFDNWYKTMKEAYEKLLKKTETIINYTGKVDQ